MAGGASDLVLAVDESGRITRVFSDPEHVAGGVITTAEPRDRHLYLGSLTGQGIARCPLGKKAR